LPIAVACVASNSTAKDSALFIKTDWEAHVSDRHRDYIEDAFQEWAKVLENNPGEIPPLMLEFSVGPFRAVKDGECDEQEMIPHVEGFLMGAYQRFASS
jgi:hypothetical protein